MKLAGSSERRVFNLHLNIHRLGCVLERGGSRSPAVDASVPRKHTSVTRRFEHEPRVSDAISISGKGLTPPPLQGKGKNRKSLEKFETKAENRERTVGEDAVLLEIWMERIHLRDAPRMGNVSSFRGRYLLLMTPLSLLISKSEKWNLPTVNGFSRRRASRPSIRKGNDQRMEYRWRGTNDSSNRIYRDNRTVIKYSIRFGSLLGQRWLSFLLSNIYQEFLFRKTVALNRELENARDGGGGGLNF